MARVLLVDEDAESRQTIEELLRAEGHEVDLAATGDAVVQGTPSFVPDVVLADLRRPGPELLRVLKLLAIAERPRPASANLRPLSPHTRLALQLIDQHYGDPAFGIHGAATKCGITREHLARLIHKDTDRTFTDLLRERRMREARTLLVATRLRIKDIYQRVGFTSASEFDHAFKHTSQLSPKAFRRAPA